MMELKCYRCSAWPCVCKDRQTIIHGDCREVLPLLEPVDLVLTDPPYGLGNRLQGGTWGTKFRGGLDWDQEAPCLRFLFPMTTHAIIWGGNYFSLTPSRCWFAWIKRDAVKTMASLDLAWTTFDSPGRFFDYTIAATNGERNGHPTQKPLALMRWCIQQAPDDVQTVLDPFLGSGTTLVACKLLGRRGIGIEIEDRYCEIAANRLRQGVLDFED